MFRDILSRAVHVYLSVSSILMKIVLYITDACSLCDQAFDLVCEVPELSGYILETLDIASEETLFEEYEELIPVLNVENEQLLWPFSRDDVSNLLRKVFSRSLE